MIAVYHSRLMNVAVVTYFVIFGFLQNTSLFVTKFSSVVINSELINIFHWNRSLDSVL